MNTLTILFLNLRLSNFYSETLLKEIKSQYNVRFAAVVDQNFEGKIHQNIEPYLDSVYALRSSTVCGALTAFDINELSSIVEKEISKTGELRIVCTEEFNLMSAGILRRKYNLYGYTDVDLAPFRDKALMKKILRDAGIRVPKFKLLENDDNFDSLTHAISECFVIKPVDSAGSFGVYIIRDENDYNDALKKVKGDNAVYEVEEYIDGVLYHVDTCTINNKIVFSCANEYSIPNHEFTKGKPLGSIAIDPASPLNGNLLSFSSNVLACLGSKNLVNHMEIFVTKSNELVFLEVAARPPGGPLCLVHNLNHGINLSDQDFFIQTNLFVSLPKNNNAKKAFWMLFPSQQGKIRSFRQPNIDSYFDVSYLRNVGDTITSAECNNNMAINATSMIYNNDMDVLRNDFLYLKNFVLTEMDVI